MKLRADGFPGQRQVVVEAELVRRRRQLPVARLLYPTSIGHYPVAANHYRKRSSGSADYILMLCATGNGWMDLDGRRWNVESGQAALILPGVPHAYGASAAFPWTLFWVHFAGSTAPEYAQLLSQDREAPLFSIADTATWIQQFETLSSSVTTGFSDEALITSSTQLAYLLCMTGSLRARKQRKPRQSERRILASIAYMTENYHLPLTLPGLAAQAGLSIPQYGALFRRQTGTSPTRFLTRIRMRNARDLLTHTSEPIATIARAVGIEDPLYFSRLFKRQVGQPPSRYRRLTH